MPYFISMVTRITQVPLLIFYLPQLQCEFFENTGFVLSLCLQHLENRDSMNNYWISEWKEYIISTLNFRLFKKY